MKRGDMKLFRLFVAFLFLVTCSSLALGGQWKTYTKENSGLADNEVRAISLDSIGAVWFGTKNGLTRFDGAGWKTYTTADKLAHNTVNAIAFETTSHGPEIWVATDDGVSVVSVNPDAITFATPYRKDNTGLISNMVSSAAVDTGHVKWFGTDIGAATFSGTEWKSYTTENMFTGSAVVKSVAASSQGMVYLGTQGSGAIRFDGVTTATPFDTFYTKIASDSVYAIYISPDDTRWFGTDLGVSRHTGTSVTINWTTFTVNDGLAGDFVHAIAPDVNGLVWVGSEGGVSSFDGSTWKKYTKQDGLAGNNVYAIAADPDGSMWFGTEAGVSNYKDGTVVVGKTEILPSALTIRRCFPNPFNPQVTIEYYLPSEGFVELSIYNLAGQKIRQLEYTTRNPGVHTVIWDGYDDNGMKASSGTYISHVKMGKLTASKSMVLLK